MSKNLSQINTGGKTSKKQNPFVDKKKDVVSKSVRVYEKDFDKVREMAFKENRKIVEILEEAIDSLYKSREYDKK
ncbi:hypothetical protein AB3N02_21975 [Priestia aryabhattai]|uniref:hypothetical protein n=1 Tax=Priestia aryabhattai TaxID=412384 RepID=UPI0039A12FE0